MAKKPIVGIDVGGTFTDIAVLTDGRLEVHKLPSTPSDPSIGIALQDASGRFWQDLRARDLSRAWEGPALTISLKVPRAPINQSFDIRD